ncbi:MAG: hypothetical protein B7Z72_06285, partial [Gemmatimonadetes bacterium 21-71-4]
MTDLGNIALWIALLVGLWGSVVGFVAGRTKREDLARSAEHAIFALWGLLVIASAGLMHALLTHDFNVEFVAAYTSRNLPVFYTWSAFYAGQNGSLLLWAVVTSTFASIALLVNRGKYKELTPYVASTMA